MSECFTEQEVEVVRLSVVVVVVILIALYLVSPTGVSPMVGIGAMARATFVACEMNPSVVARFVAVCIVLLLLCLIKLLFTRGVAVERKNWSPSIASSCFFATVVDEDNEFLACVDFFTPSTLEFLMVSFRLRDEALHVSARNLVVCGRWDCRSWCLIVAGLQLVMPAQIDSGPDSRACRSQQALASKLSYATTIGPLINISQYQSYLSIISIDP